MLMEDTEMLCHKQTCEAKPLLHRIAQTRQKSQTHTHTSNAFGLTIQVVELRQQQVGTVTGQVVYLLKSLDICVWVRSLINAKVQQ